MKNKEPIEKYKDWCKLCGYNPSHIENVFRYKRMIERLNQPKWEFVTDYPSGKRKTYICYDYPYGRISKIIASAIDNDARMRIYRVNPDQTRTLLHDSELVKAAMEEEECCAG